MEKREQEDCSLYRGCKLFLGEDGLEVVRINCGIASILLRLQEVDFVYFSFSFLFFFFLIYFPFFYF